jgi:hypothetical protein
MIEITISILYVVINIVVFCKVQRVKISTNYLFNFRLLL